MRESTNVSGNAQACAAQEAPLTRWWVLALILIVPGVGLRVWRAFLADLPMRVDEIRLAWNLFHRDWAQLAEPLNHQQAAPLGFLWCVDVVIMQLGRETWALRLVPLIAGLGAMAMIPLAVRRITGRVGLVFAIAITSLAPWAIQYSSDFKQYSTDVLCTAFVLLIALHALEPGAKTRSRALFTLAGCITICFSHPAALVVAGFGLTLVGAALLARRWREALEWFVSGTIIAAVLAGIWWINLRHISGRDDLMTYWAQNFMPLPPRSWGQAVWYPRAVVEWLNTSGFYCNPLILVLAVAGLIELRKRPALLVLLMSPVAITLAASAFHAYPFSGRMIVFLMPCTVAVLAIGCQSLATGLNLTHTGNRPSPSTRRPKGEWVAIAAVILSFALTVPFSQLAQPWVGGRYDFREPFDHAAAGIKPGDGLIVESRLYFIYKRYAEEHGLPVDAPLRRLPYFQGDPRGLRMHDEAMKHDRLWIIAAVNTRVSKGHYVDTHSLLLPLLAEFGPPTRIEQTDTVALWLFERQEIEAPTQVPTPNPDPPTEPQ